jgi:ferric-dicitrate binding protein FerR (iron transport regulator)
MIQKLKGKEIAQDQFDAALGQEPDAALERDFNQLWTLSGKYKANSFKPDVEFNLQKFKSRVAASEAPIRLIRSNTTSWWLVAAVTIGIALGLWWLLRPSQEVKWQTIAASATAIRQVTLPDGSMVRLNRNSTLSFPQRFNQQPVRKIKLNGEAFFSVQHRSKQAFEIETTFSTVKVLGTKFNLRALPGEAFTEVEVEEGLVLFFDKTTGKSIHLPKNAVGYRSTDGQLKKTVTKTLLAQIWSSGKIFCDATPLSQVKEVLERHSNLHIRFTEPRFGDFRVTGYLYLDRAENSFRAAVLTAGLNLEKDKKGELQVK